MTVPVVITLKGASEPKKLAPTDVAATCHAPCDIEIVGRETVEVDLGFRAEVQHGTALMFFGHPQTLDEHWVKCELQMVGTDAKRHSIKVKLTNLNGHGVVIPAGDPIAQVAQVHVMHPSFGAIARDLKEGDAT